jgi:uncharacterized protein (TIGR02300 family)
LTFTAGVRRGKRALRITPFFDGNISLVKADLGTKRGCPSCNARFYDLEKRPIVCPKCDFSYEPESLFKQRRRQPEPASVVRAADSEDEEDEDEENEDAESDEDEEAEVVEEAPLIVAATGEDEEEEAEEPETAEGMSVVETDEDGAEIEDIEVEDDEDEEDNDLLGEVEDEEDDVSGIIDADITKDEA